jgi:hypothetical protein
MEGLLGAVRFVRLISPSRRARLTTKKNGGDRFTVGTCNPDHQRTAAAANTSDLDAWEGKMSDPTRPGTSVPEQGSPGTPDTQNQGKLPPAGLSARAWGVYCYLLSTPNAPRRIGHLREIFTEGQTAISKAMDELISAGLITRKRVRSATGTVAIRVVVHQ